MGDGDDQAPAGGSVIHSSDGSISGEHDAPSDYPLLVGPATSKEKNTLRPGIPVVACWRLEDIRFDFDSSFVRPDSQPDFKKLAELIKAHPKAPVSIFGHADPVGTEAYNKKLSGRRAIAVYAILIRNADMWENLYSSPYHGDKWGPPQILAMLEMLGYSPGKDDGLLQGNASDILKKFQTDNGLTGHGYLNAATRKKLYTVYMDKLCGADFKLQKSDFLAKGADADGRGDYQGCSKFNPLLIFSSAEEQEYSQPGLELQRNAVNAPNRRVMVFLFKPGLVVNPAQWPCPKADTEAVDACKKRFWSNGAARLQNTANERRYNSKAILEKKELNTFACRFYERLCGKSPCERAEKQWVVRILAAGTGPVANHQPIANEPYELRGVGASEGIVKGRTDSKGFLRAAVSDETPTMTLAIAGNRLTLKGGTLQQIDAGDPAAKQRLYNLGYGDQDFASWTDDSYSSALKQFQHDQGLTESGTADDDTKQKLKEIHGS